MPSKYDDAKTLKPTRARDEWSCDNCGKTIISGETYYRESLGLINKPPGMKMRAFCETCFKEKGSLLIKLKVCKQKQLPLGQQQL